MKTPISIYRFLLILAGLCLLAFIIIRFSESQFPEGIFLTLSFVILALAFRGIEKFKSFSYTVWIFAAVTVSMYYPHYFLKVGEFELKKLIVPLLQIIMFGMGSQMSVKDFAGVIKMPKGVFIGLALQFSIMPVIGVTIATTFGFPPEIAAGIVLVGSSPSGLASNVMSFLAKANLALSVTLTAIATLLAPLVTPILMEVLGGQFIPVNFWKMMIGIIEMVILPIIAGLAFNAIAYGKESNKRIMWQVVVYILIVIFKNGILYMTTDTGLNASFIALGKNLFWFIVLPVLGGYFFKYFIRSSKEALDHTMAFLSMLGIAIIITIITAAGRDSLLEIGFLLIFACLLHNSLGYFLGYWICRMLGMDERSSRTIALEVGMQNAGLASGIALQMGKVATVGLAPAVFGPMMNITGSSLAIWWRGKKPADGENEQ